MTNKISAGTIARTVVLLLALVNQVLSMPVSYTHLTLPTTPYV